MQIPVLIERIAGNGYRATGGQPFALTADGATRDEALGKLRQLIDRKLATGSDVVELEISPNENPWLKLAGTLDPAEPMVQEWLEVIKENRRKVDEDPKY